MAGARAAPWRSEIGAALVAVLVARTAFNGGLRVVYPFLPQIADGLGVSLATVSVLLALRSVAGMGAPFVARPAEAWGRRTVMLAAGAALIVGCVATMVAPLGTGAAVVGVAGLGFALIGVAKPAFDVSMQTWFGDRVPYAQRGRVLGVTELTWALALLATVPVSGVLIAATSWQAPFVLVAVIAVAGTALVARLIPAEQPVKRHRSRLRLTRPRVAMLAVVVLFATASELLFLVYGAWLSDSLGLDVAAVGVFTLVVVAAELCGEGLVAAFGDRIGLRRSILAGLVGSAMAYVGIGFVGGSLAAAVAVVVGWFVAFEVTVVATVPFVTELAPEARERLQSLAIATISAGRGIAALAAPALFAAAGIDANGLAAAGCVLLAAALLAALVAPEARMSADRERPIAPAPG
jgi:predicted MFS family arabinose efflux permease